MEVFYQFFYVGQSFWHFPADGASVEPSELSILNRVAAAHDRVDPFYAKATSKHGFSDVLAPMFTTWSTENICGYCGNRFIICNLFEINCRFARTVFFFWALFLLDGLGFLMKSDIFNGLTMGFLGLCLFITGPVCIGDEGSTTESSVEIP